MMRSYKPRSLRTLVGWRHYLRGKDAVGLQPLLTCWRNGFYSDKSRYYDFDRYAPELYLPDSGRWPRSQAQVLYNARCEDKVAFFLQMRAIGGPTPEVVAENAEGRLIYYTQPEDFETLLDLRGELVIKPRSGGQGKGVQSSAPATPTAACSRVSSPRPRWCSIPTVRRSTRPRSTPSGC